MTCISYAIGSDVYRYSYIGYILSTRTWLQGLRTLPWWKAWPKRCRSLRECQLCLVNWHSNEHVGRNCRWFSLSIIPKKPGGVRIVHLKSVFQATVTLMQAETLSLYFYTKNDVVVVCVHIIASVPVHQVVSAPLSNSCCTWKKDTHDRKKYLVCLQYHLNLVCTNWILCQFFMPPDAQKRIKHQFDQ